MTFLGLFRLLGIVAFALSVNSVLLYAIPRRKRKGVLDAEPQPNGKILKRLVALLFAELLLTTLGLFTWAYVISLNSTLALEGDAKALKAYWNQLVPNQEVVHYNDSMMSFLRYQGQSLSYFPGTPVWFQAQDVQSALYNSDWSREAAYHNYRSRINETAADTFWLEPEQMLKQAQETDEALLRTIPLRMPPVLARFFFFFASDNAVLDYADTFYIQGLSLRGQWDRLFLPRTVEHCIRVVLVPHSDGKSNGYLPLAFGETQIAQLKEPYKESDVYYLYVRSRFSQLSIAYQALFFFNALTSAMTGFIFALIISVGIQNAISARQERRQQKEKTDFLIAIAHDLKTPMGTASLYAENIRHSQSLEQAREHTASMQREVLRMRDRLSTLLMLSKMEEAVALNRSTFALDDLLEDVSDEYVPQMEENDIQFSIPSLEEVKIYIDQGAGLHHFAPFPGHFYPKLKEQNIPVDFTLRRGIMVHADRARIRIVLSNYLSNAVKFTPKGGEIQLTLQARGRNYVRASVFNSGSHIAKEDMARIWNHLYKSDKNNAAQKGTGLGLPIVRKIVALHNGHCGAENVQDGVVFWFELPVGNRRK